MKLIEAYSTHSCLNIDKPILKDEFYPLVEKDYITFHCGAGEGKFTSKVYDYWQHVIYLIKPLITQKIVQIGGDKEPLIDGVDIDLRGRTKIRQTFYILKHARLHFGNDSFPCHAAGSYNVPIVAVYGSTTINNHGPYWKNNESILIEADRKGNKPSYSLQEPNKFVNTILPETIANAILKVLGKEKTSIETLYMGRAACEAAIEYIPNFPFNPQLFQNIVITARADYHLDENHLFNLVSQRPVNIITDKQLNLGALKSLKRRITMVNYEVKNDSDPVYLEELKRTGVHFKLFTQAPAEEIPALRFKFFDVGNLEEIRYEGEKVEGATHFRTNKILLADGKLFSSYAHFLEKKSLDSIGKPDTVIDRPEFWRDRQFFWLFK